MAASSLALTYPVMLSLNLAHDDSGIREYIRLNATLPMKVQKVICEDSRYANKTYADWVNLKIRKGLPCGGGWSERYVPIRHWEARLLASGSPEGQK